MGRVFWYVWLVFAGLNLVDLAVRGESAEALLLGWGLVTVTALVYLLAVRPRIIAADDAVTLRNPLRDARVPWAEVKRIEVADSIVVRTERGSFRSWALHTSARRRARQGANAAREIRAGADPAVIGRTHLDFVAEQLTEKRAEASRASAPAQASRGSERAEASRAGERETGPVVQWSALALFLLIVPLAVLVALVVLLTG